jgi:hypothetical protein
MTCSISRPLAQILNEHFPDVRIVVQGQDVRSDGFHGGLVGASAGEFRLQPADERGLIVTSETEPPSPDIAQ